MQWSSIETPLTQFRNFVPFMVFQQNAKNCVKKIELKEHIDVVLLYCLATGRYLC